MNRPLAPAAVLLLALCVPLFLTGQNPPSRPPLPSNPVALLKLASQVNGLHGDDLKPWHLRATWQTLDEKGQPIEQGRFEEWWAGKDEIKVTLSSPGFQQTRWVTPAGEFVAGDQRWPSWKFRSLYEVIQNPLPTEKSIEKMSLRHSKEKQRSVVMECGEMPGDSKYCFSDNLPAVRTKETLATKTVFNSLIQLQGRYLAREMRVFRVDMPAIEFDIDLLENMPAIQGANMQPDSDAAACSYWIGDSEGKVEPGRRIDAASAVYPPGSTGAVEVAAIVGNDGLLRNPEVIGGPHLLQAPVLNSLKTWRFKPYLLNGRPTEVAIVIQIVH